MLEISPSNARNVGSILVGELRSHMSQGQKKQNRSNIVVNSIKTLRMGHISKKKKKKGTPTLKKTDKKFP